MKTLWIHAGMPKNGSSALQVFFAQNIEKLKKADIDYLLLSSINDAKSGQISSGNGALFARSLLNKKHEAYYEDKSNELHDKFIELVKNSESNNLLISSEFFSVIPLNNIERLKEELLHLNITVKFIYYVREQTQFLMSSYMQRVKRHGLQETPNEYIKSSYKNIHFLNYYGYAMEYINILGEENVLPFIFEYTKKHEKGIAGHFVETLIGLTPDWINLTKNINTSPSPRELKIMLMMNKYKPRMKLSDFLVDDSVTRGDSKAYKNHNIIDKELHQELQNHFSEQNKSFVDKFNSGESFPQKEYSDYIDLNSITFSDSEVLDIISGFLVRFDRRISRLESQ
jgi:hypothetical protein